MAVQVSPYARDQWSGRNLLMPTGRQCALSPTQDEAQEAWCASNDAWMWLYPQVVGSVLQITQFILEFIGISLKRLEQHSNLLITKQLLYSTFRPRGYPKYTHLFHFQFLLFLPCCSWGYFTAAVSHSSNNFHGRSFHLASSLFRKCCDGVEGFLSLS